jgi:para-aminobenzoate synthetase/4-amino-4-deoxychorismate lyase
MRNLPLQQPYVLLHTDRGVDRDRPSLFFEKPVAVLRLDSNGDPRAYFDAIERATLDGRWVVGYFAYETGYLLEPRLQPLLRGMSPTGPLAWAGVFEGPSSGPATGDDGFSISSLRLNTTSAEYAGAIERIKSRIVEGDTYQVNFTFKQTFDLEGAPEALYEALRRRQRVAYSACLFDGERTVISLSPELFFRRVGDTITARPMKGTARRGADPLEDGQLEAWLAADAKNRAENVMIVDMIRNDLGRIARVGGVRVPCLFEVEPYQTLFQMTSTVQAQVSPATPWFDVFRALFPCGSVTGAPKIRTMELIAGLEKEPRGIYTGAIGYIAPDGGACFNVAIRTIVVDGDGHAEMGIGSGVVYDSSADAEYEECLLKGRFVTGASHRFELIETMLLLGGEIYLRDRHLKRLGSSAAHYGFDYPAHHVGRVLDDECRRHPEGRCKLRLLLDSGGNVSISCSPLAATPAAFRVKVSAERVDPSDEFLYHKTTYRPLYRCERESAIAQGFDEVLFVNTDGEVCEGSVSNVFVKTGGELITPPVSCGLLPGTLREELIASGACRERVLDLSDIRDAERVFVGNSVTGLVEALLDS